MKGKRHTTEEKIRMLREVDGGRSVREGRVQLGVMELNEARRPKELGRENSELKKMLAGSLLKNRV